MTGEVENAVRNPSTQQMILQNISKLTKTGREQATKLAGVATGKVKSIIDSRRGGGVRSQSEDMVEDFDEFDADLDGEPPPPQRNKQRGGNLVANITSQASRLVSQVTARFSGGKGRPQMYLRQRGPNRNWRVLVLVALVIGFGLFFGIRRLADDRERESFILSVETEISAIEDRIDNLELEASTASISKGKEDEKSRILSKLDVLISDANSLKSNEIDVDKLDAVISRADESKDLLQNIRSISDPLVVADLGINFENARLSDIAFSDGKVFVSDEGRDAIYRLNTSANSDPAVFVSDLEQPYLLDTDQDGNLVFIDRNPDSVIGVVNKDSGEVTRQAGLSSSRIGELADFDVWTNAAMYSVNPSKNAIVKQDNFGGGFSLPNDSAPWRSDPDLSRAKDIEVDFWIYILQQGQGLVRYLSGEPDEFGYSGLLSADKGALKQASAFDITDTHLYIADSVNQRVFVFIKRVDDNKVMEYVEQYVYRGEANVFKDIKDIVADPSTNQLFVLDGSRIVRLDL